MSLLSAQVVAAIDSELAKHGQAAPPSLVRSRLMLLVRAEVPNPSFDSQSKDSLTTSAAAIHASAPAGNLALPAAFLRRLVQNSGVVESILADLEQRERGKLQRQISAPKSNKVLVPKLEDAHLAGTPRSAECSLILTEGDSAKALAVAGLEVLGRQTYGVLPLRGKILNVRGATNKQLAGNSEFTMLVQTLGLKFDRAYALGPNGDPAALAQQGLRYGKILIMTDQDHDGAHIKGLLLNLFHRFWPSLLEVPGFLQQFVTPLVKVKELGRGSAGAGASAGASASAGSATNVNAAGAANAAGTANAAASWAGGRGGGGGAGSVRDFSRNTLDFYSLPEFEKWAQARADAASASASAAANSTNPNSSGSSGGSGGGGGRFIAKYYKGLGTNTAAEGRAYFSALQLHQKAFTSPDPASTAEAIDLAFNADRAKDRRHWLLSKYDPHAFTPPAQRQVSIPQFVDTELIQFSFADNARSIPSVVDGLKPAQRKVLFGCFKRRLDREEVKVVQLAGYIAEQTAYHHGEASLHSTIINMAQDFVGSNNIPLLNAGGQFGTRAQGGQDAASPRYIFTSLSPLARLLFPEADDAQLQHQREEGQSVEPSFYVPVVSLLAINGAQGIGTGWSTLVPVSQSINQSRSLALALALALALLLVLCSSSHPRPSPPSPFPLSPLPSPPSPSPPSPTTRCPSSR